MEYISMALPYVYLQGSFNLTVQHTSRHFHIVGNNIYSQQWYVYTVIDLRPHKISYKTTKKIKSILLISHFTNDA
ncbi:hypothetical protein [Winogradskyella thalassocola]|uniref:hypothetical protein n=1 Tax=Winogradskyella thalassocola TaxID=262004 RepID=UPI00111430F2|nr:hypothetical protein [Winogradskyella thalassocola]